MEPLNHSIFRVIGIHRHRHAGTQARIHADTPGRRDAGTHAGTHAGTQAGTFSQSGEQAGRHPMLAHLIVMQR